MEEEGKARLSDDAFVVNLSVRGVEADEMGTGRVGSEFFFSGIVIVVVDFEGGPAEEAERATCGASSASFERFVVPFVAPKNVRRPSELPEATAECDGSTDWCRTASRSCGDANESAQAIEKALAGREKRDARKRRLTPIRSISLQASSDASADTFAFVRRSSACNAQRISGSFKVSPSNPSRRLYSSGTIGGTRGASSDVRVSTW